MINQLLLVGIGSDNRSSLFASSKMTANIQEEVDHIVELKSRATHIDNLIQGYRLSAW